MTLHIRLAAPTDYAAIERIETAADQLLIDWLTPDSWEAAPSGASRAAVPGYILVAQEAEASAVIGFVHVLERDLVAHLEQLSVLPGHGRRGHGRALVEAAKSEARRRGYQCLSLRTYSDVPWNPSTRAPASSKRIRPPPFTSTSRISSGNSGSTVTVVAFR